MPGAERKTPNFFPGGPAPELSDYNEFLTSMWRNFSRIGLGFRKLESNSELFEPENFGDSDLSAETFVRKFAPIFLGQFDEEDLILGFGGNNVSKVKSLSC